MDWELQGRFEHLSDQDLSGNQYLDYILEILDVMAGEKKATEMRRTVRRALFEGTRRSDEGIAQFALRRDQEFSLAEKYMQIPDDLKGIMLEEQAGLGKQGVMNLRTLTNGQTDYQSVSRALKVLDLEDEGMLQKGKSSHFVGMASGSGDGPEEEEDDTDSELSLNEEEETAILAEISKLDLYETQAMEVFMTLEKEKKTWKENKKLKLLQKKDRRHFTDKSSRPFVRKPYSGGDRKDKKKRFNTDAIKKVSRCGNCGDRGHWAEDCTKPYRSKAERLEQERAQANKGGGVGGGKSSGFVFLGGASSAAGYVGGPVLWSQASKPEENSWHYAGDKDVVSDEHYESITEEGKGMIVALGSFNGMAMPDFAKKVLEQFKAVTEVFLSMPPGHAIIDPGAGQDLIGKPSYERLRSRLASVGLRPIPVDDEPARASGIGGQATTLFMALVPTILGGAPGIVRVTVVLEDIPHLLSIGLLESAGSVIDTKANVIRFEEHGTEDKMIRLQSGHRMLDVTKWSGGAFPVPEQVRDQYGLAEGAFNTRDMSAERVYMAEPQGDQWVEQEGCPFVLKVHSSERRKCYVPTPEEANELGNIRVTVKQLADGSVMHSLDNWRERERSDESSSAWTGVSIFLKNVKLKSSFLSSSSDAALGSREPQVFLDTPSQEPFNSHASRRQGIMGENDESHAGEGSPEGEGEAGRDDRMSSSLSMHSGGGQSIRSLEEVPSLSDQDMLHPSPPEAGEGEGEDGSVRGHEGVRRHGGGSPRTSSGRERGEEVELYGNIIRGRPSCSGHDSGRVQQSAHGRYDYDYVSGSDPSDSRATVPAGTDSEISRSTDPDDADGTAGTEPDDGHGGSGGPSDEEVSGRRGVGSSASERSLRLDCSSTPRTALRPMTCRQLKDAKIEPYITEDGKVKVCWETEDLYTYLNEEDLNDDYECGISANVRRATKKVLQAELEEDTTLSEIEKSDKESFSGDSFYNTQKVEPYKVMELFSPPRVTKAIAERTDGVLCTSQPPAYDLDTGWDFFNYKDRKRFWDDLNREDPDLVLMTPECRGFTTLMNVNWDKMDSQARKELQTRALAMFQFCIQVADHRLQRDRHFLLEQPDGASSWNTHAAVWLAKQKGVLHVSFDQCEAGLQVHPDGPSKKRTSFMLNHLGIAAEVTRLQCSGNHKHVVLEHGLPHLAQQWPRGLVESIIYGLTEQMLWSYVAEQPVEDEAEDEAEGELQEERNAEGGRVAEETPMTHEQKEMVKRIHVNMGHLPVDRMLVMMKAAKAQPKVLRYIRDHMQCEECMRQRKEIRRRRAAYPRTFEFNKIIGGDIFFVKWGGKKMPFLNVVDHGSNWQAVSLVRPAGGGDPSGGNPTAQDTWRTFLRMWIRPHGSPEAMVTDGGMEFRGRFERGLEQHSVLQAVTDIQSPWQNGRVERHGQWIKDRMDLEVASGSSLIENLEDLENLAIEIVNCKNIWFSRGGYSPAQIVYGRNPRLPAELLSDANESSPGWSDALCDPGEMDTPAFEFKRAHQIREAAKKLAMESTARDKVREAARPPLHKYRTWSAGQWVLVWRAATGGERARWIGPGLVILQNGHTVYVAMRSRLWKCNTDQLRPANEAEELAMQVITSEQYKDLLQQMQGQRTGAIDVAREGSPPEEAWRRPRTQREEAETIQSGGGSRAEAGEQRELGEESSGSQSSPGVGHPLRSTPLATGPPREREAQALERRVSRRISIDTVSEPMSEPMMPRNSDKSEEAESKRRRMLENIQETAQEEEDERPEVLRSSAASSSAAATAGSAVRPTQASTVAEHVQEIESRPHMRRRSRSPVPEVILRQMRQHQTPDEEVDEDLFNEKKEEDSSEGYEEEEQNPRWKEAFKEESVLHNLFVEEEPDPASKWHQNMIKSFNFFALNQAEGDQEVWAVEPARNGEITWKQMTEEEIVKFQESDLKEWESLEKEFKAVKVWKGEEARKLRERYPDRIMSSRMVRRKKPMPGIHQYKAKSRFCVHGHKDPDGGTFRTFAPTPSTEALNLVCQVISNAGLHMMFADVKAAFAQSNKLRRPKGRLFVAPCEGTPLEEQDLIELIVPVYGLDDAPLRWFETVTEFLKSLGLRKSLLDPCVYIKNDEEGGVETLILIEVDDFLIATKDEETQKELQQKLQTRFQFGKWEKGEADFIGRHIKQLKGEIRMDQEKYIIEKLEAVDLKKGRRSNKEADLEPEEFVGFRSMLYRVSWVAHQTRPEAAGTVSILSSRLHKATVGDAILLNKMIGYLRSTSTQGLRIQQFYPKDMTFIGISDAGGVDGDVRGYGPGGLPEDPVQGAWLVLASNLLPAHDQKIKVSVLSWRSSKLKRRVTSTMASETLSLSQCLGEIEWLQIFYRDIFYGDVQTRDWRKSTSPFLVYLPQECELKSRQQECSVTDAKSLYDALYRQCPTSRQDRRTALELAVIIDLMQKAGSNIRWTPHQRMPVDCLTKADITKGNGALGHLLKTGVLRIDKEEHEMLRRQRDAGARSRTRRASEKLLRLEDGDEEEYFSLALAAAVWSTENSGSWEIHAPLNHKCGATWPVSFSLSTGGPTFGTKGVASPWVAFRTVQFLTMSSANLKLYVFFAWSNLQ